MEKLRIPYPVVVEGKYDKIKLQTILDADIFPVGGFSVFNQKETASLLCRLAETRGLIILTDSDGGGRQIRSFLTSRLPRERVFHLYIPKLEGKEKRKKQGGKAGLLGVEGMTDELLLSLFRPFASEEGGERGRFSLTKARLYEDGLSGRPLSREKREALAALLALPGDLSAAAFAAAVSLLYDEETYRSALQKMEESFHADA